MDCNEVWGAILRLQGEVTRQSPADIGAVHVIWVHGHGCAAPVEGSDEKYFDAKRHEDWLRDALEINRIGSDPYSYPAPTVECMCDESMLRPLMHAAMYSAGKKPTGSAVQKRATARAVEAISQGVFVVLLGTSHGGSVASRVAERLSRRGLGSRAALLTFGTSYVARSIDMATAHFVYEEDSIATNVIGRGRTAIAQDRGFALEAGRNVVWLKNFFYPQAIKWEEIIRLHTGYGPFIVTMISRLSLWSLDFDDPTVQEMFEEGISAVIVDYRAMKSAANVDATLQ